MEYITSEYQSFYHEILTWKAHGAELEEDYFFLNFFKCLFCGDSTCLVRPCIFSSFIIFVIPKICFLAVERLLN
jgi:hypothetical protein